MITIYVRDLSGNEYACQATITNDYELNGNRELSATILPSKVNRLFIDDISEMWEITDFDDVAHKIVYAKKKGEGNLLSVEIKSVPLFFDTFDTERIYEEYNEHMTAMRCFTLIFEDSGYNFVLVDSFDAIEWQGLGGGETRLEMFKRALNRYGAEFRISGNTVYLHKQVGRDTQFQYRHRLNASNIVQENDATAMWTYAKGYGDFEEGDEEGGGGWENANLIREYTSPLANIPQIGIRHAPPIKDGRVKIASVMDKALKELVDESLKISVTADIHDLRRQGYPLAQPELGDRVFLIDERIGLDEEVRVVDISITRNWRGEVIDLNLTFGSEGITKRYQSNLSTAIKNITEVMAGRKKIPMSAYDQAVINATATLKRVTSELTVPSNGGLMAVDKNNPNNVVIFNAAGIGVSDDGGATFKTAMTGEGVVADVITAGTLDTSQVIIRGGNATEYTFIQGAFLESRGQFVRTWRGTTKTHDITLRLQDGYFRARNNTEDQSLYFSDMGISTYADGGTSQDASGTLAFRDTYYSPALGVTLQSQQGAVALQSTNDRIVLDAEFTVNIESKTSSVYIRPMIQNRVGNNEFRFWIKDGSNVANTDGVLSYGSMSAGQASGLRFDKELEGRPMIYATDGNGDRFTGAFNADWYYGRRLINRLSTGYIYVGSSSGLRVTSTSTNEGSNISFRNVEANQIWANALRTNPEVSGVNLYLGVSATEGGEVRVTNLEMAGGSTIGYMPIRSQKYLLPDGSSAFGGLSSLMYARPQEDEAINLIKETDLIRYTDGGEPAYKFSDTSKSIDEMLGTVIKATQELIEKVGA